MQPDKRDVTTIATQLLSGMLANPHIYSTVSDDEAKGQQERILISNAVMMAEALLEKIDESHHGREAR